jgi:hypothetical protein
MVKRSAGTAKRLFGREGIQAKFNSCSFGSGDMLPGPRKEDYHVWLKKFN